MHAMADGLFSGQPIGRAAPQHHFGRHTEIRQDLGQIQAAHALQMHIGERTDWWLAR